MAETNLLAGQLTSGTRQMGIDLTAQQKQALLEYLALLDKWNKAYNLTAIRDPGQMVPLHLLDSLSVNDSIQNADRMIDVGTGPGLPGVVLAIMNPHKSFTLLDSNGKKTRFLFQAKTALALENVNIVNDRVEAYHPGQPFDMIISRAFASLGDMVHWCRHLAGADGCFLAMKGQYPESEVESIQHEFAVTAVNRPQIPGIEAERHVLLLKALSKTEPC